VRGDHLDAQRQERLVERSGGIGARADAPLGQFGYTAGVAGGSDEGDFMRRSRGGTCGERKTKAVCHCPARFVPLPRVARSHAAAPFVATLNVPSMTHAVRSRPPRSLRSVASPVNTRYPFARSVAGPALEAAVAGLVWRIALGQVGPLRPRAQDPQHGH